VLARHLVGCLLYLVGEVIVIAVGIVWQQHAQAVLGGFGIGLIKLAARRDSMIGCLKNGWFMG